MQQWEYLRVWVAFDEKLDNTIVARVNGKKLAKRDVTLLGSRVYYEGAPLLDPFLQQLGDEGWELVVADHSELVFKRPKAE